MNTDITNYIESGTNMVLGRKQYITLLLSPALFLPINLLIGIVLGGFYKVFSIVMMSICLLVVLAGLVLFRKKNIVSELWCQLLIFIHFILQLTTIQTICFIMTYGLRFTLMLLYLPILLIPAVLTFVHHKMIKRNALIVHKTSNSWKYGLIGGCTGWSGYRLAALMSRTTDISQNSAILVLLLFVLLINSFLSIGLLNFHKIYLVSQS